MKWTEWWRIVPQLGVLLCVLPPAALAEPRPVPTAPATLEQAQALLSEIEKIRSDADAEFERQRAACYERTFVSGCLKDVNANQARYRRDLNVTEVKAKEVIRIEQQRIKDLKKPPVAGDREGTPAASGVSPSTSRAEGEAPADAVNPVGRPARGGKKDRLQGPAATPEAASPDAPSTPSVRPGAQTPRRASPLGAEPLSEAEQARNRADYEARQKEAADRQARNEARLRETEERRARYKARQAERAANQERRAEASRKAAERGVLPFGGNQTPATEGAAASPGDAKP